jgi:hypothetical protein
MRTQLEGIAVVANIPRAVVVDIDPTVGTNHEAGEICVVTIGLARLEALYELIVAFGSQLGFPYLNLYSACYHCMFIFWLDLVNILVQG